MLSIRTQMLGLVGALLALILGMQGVYLNLSKADLLSEQIGMRALSVAKTVAVIPELVEAFNASDPAVIIQPIAERVRAETGAAYISLATGTLVEAMRGKTPVRNTSGDIIGVVSVGFLQEKVSQDVGSSLYLGWLMIEASVLLGLTGAVWISMHLKRLILGLEPHEIARLVNEKEAILQSIHEGLVAVNRDGRITLLNQSAKRTLGILDDREYLGALIDQLVPNSRLQEVLTHGERQFDRELWVGDVPVIVNRIPIINPQGGVDGAVSNRFTFFNKQRGILHPES